MMNWISQKLDRLVDGIGGLAAIVTLILAVLLVSDLAGRFFFSKPIPQSFELSRYLFFIIITLAFSYAQKQNAHIRVEFLLNRLPAKSRLYINVVAQIFTLAFVGHMSYRYLLFFLESLRHGETGMTLLYLKVAPVKLFFVIGFILLGLLIIRQIARSFRELRG